MKESASEAKKWEEKKKKGAAASRAPFTLKLCEDRRSLYGST